MKSVLVGKIIATEQWGDRDFLKEKRRIYTFLNPVSYLDALQHQDMFAQCREIVLKLAEELGKAYLPKVEIK